MRVIYLHDEKLSYPGIIVRSDGKNITFKPDNTADFYEVVAPISQFRKRTEEGEILPITKKDLIKFRGECG